MKGRLRNSSQYENVYITQDYAKGIQMERKFLIKAMFLARKKGMNWKVVDRNFVVNNNVYNVDNIPDNLKESSTLNLKIWNADILPGYKTDHSLITIHLASNSNPRGPGFWKLNTTFLLDSEYIELIKKTIDEEAKEYRNNDDVDAVLLWDTMKMQIGSSSLKYAREKRLKLNQRKML